MKQFLHLKAGSAFLVLIFIAMLYACNHQPKTPVVTEPADTQKPVEPAARSLPYLNLLYTNQPATISFLRDRNVASLDRLVFKYYVDAQMRLAMKAWLYKGAATIPVGSTPSQPPPSDKIKMEVGDQTAVLLSDMSLSSLVLGKGDLNKIQGKMTPSTKSLYFVPFLPDNLPPGAPAGVSKDDGIVWLIYVSDDLVPTYRLEKFMDSTSFVARAITGANFNPSPPREFLK